MAAYVTFPGTVGDFCGTADTLQILDADTAHLQQSIGKWEVQATADNFRLVSVLTPVYGDTHLAFDATSAVASGVFGASSGTGTGATPCAGSTVYAFSCVLAGSKAFSDVQLRVRWWDSGGGSLRIDNIETKAVSTSAWSLFSGTVTSPATAAFFALMPRTLADAVENDSLYVDAGCFRTGSDPTFVPSLNVVGTLFEAKDPVGFASVYTAGVDLTVGKSWAGDGYRYTRHDGADASAPVVADFNPVQIPGGDGPISNGTTWQDLTGRTWTANGTGLVKAGTSVGNAARITGFPVRRYPISASTKMIGPRV